MNEPLPGQKTNIVAAIFAVVQAIAGAGVIDPETATVANQVLAAAAALTLFLKGRRAAKRG